jgi:hypothetical protein
MRRVMLAAPWALFAYVAAISESQAAADVAECVEVAPENVAQGMSLAVHNTCDFAVHCELKWRLRCDGDAPDAAPRNMSLAVDLASAAKRQLMASGAACGERVWEITDDTWECKEVR